MAAVYKPMAEGPTNAAVLQTYPEGLFGMEVQPEIYGPRGELMHRGFLKSAAQFKVQHNSSLSPTQMCITLVIAPLEEVRGIFAPCQEHNYTSRVRCTKAPIDFVWATLPFFFEEYDDIDFKCLLSYNPTLRAVIMLMRQTVRLNRKLLSRQLKLCLLLRVHSFHINNQMAIMNVVSAKRRP